MAISSSIGYAGSVDNADWARLQAAIGHEYFVADADSVRVTPVPTGTREVDVAAGDFGGHGILDTNDAPVRLQLPSVTTGTEYFLIVARRTWGVTQATSFEVIDAGTAGTELPARNTDPGTVDDQPLALVPLTAGSTVPGAPIDLRAIGHTKGGPYSAFSELALSYLNKIGTVVKIGTNTWTRIVNGSYAASWSKDPGTFGRVAATSILGSDLIVPAAGWSAAPPMDCRGYPSGNVVDLTLELRRTGSVIKADVNNGNFVDQSIGTLGPAVRPLRPMPAVVLYGGNSNAASPPNVSLAGLIQLNPSGTITLVAGSPGVHITPMTNPAGVSLRAHISFIREDAS